MFFWFIFAGLLGGILGGMGMGGGTVLIPLLSIFYNINQHTAQAINIVSFIPMSVVAIIIHAKNKCIKYDKVLLIALSGVISCIGGVFLTKLFSSDILKRCFGGFLVALSVFNCIMGFKNLKSDK